MPATNMQFCVSRADGVEPNFCMSRPEIGCLKNNHFMDLKQQIIKEYLQQTLPITPP